ncbi:MAG TPA: CopG family transcriptional regulator [bacterium]|nr:CopG family transcriptional regulator [bacterium]
MPDKKVTIKIPHQLYVALQHQIADTGFASVTEFIVYVMRDIAASGKLDGDPALTRREVDLIKQRLKALGYL